jgi:RNA polymerase sigma-70 factor (ECF subfamily)
MCPAASRNIQGSILEYAVIGDGVCSMAIQNASFLWSLFEGKWMNQEDQLLPDEENVLIRQASNGSLEAFNLLVIRYQNMAYHHAYGILRDVASAEDVTQDSLIKAFRKIRNFHEGSFRAWLLRIVTNTAYDLLRQSQRRPTLPLFPADDFGEELESPEWLIDTSLSVENAVEHNENAQHLYQLLEELPVIYRQVLTLVDIYEMEYWEAARVLDVPVGTIKSRLARARLKMRWKLQADTNFAYPFAQSVPAMSA